MIYDIIFLNKKIWVIFLFFGFLSVSIGLNGINPYNMALANPENDTKVTFHTLRINDEEMDYSATVDLSQY